MSVQALRDAFRAGFAYGFKAPDGVTADAAFDQWYQDALEYLDRAALPLTAVDQRRQGMSCGCQGTDDYCPCQNVRLK